MIRVIDKRFRNLDVFSEARDEIDVALAVAVDHRAQFQMFGNGFLEVVAEVLVFGQDGVQILTR